MNPRSSSCSSINHQLDKNHGNSHKPGSLPKHALRSRLPIRPAAAASNETIELHRDSHSDVKKRTTFFGFTSPLQINWFLSVIGAEYCHTYIWIAKDFCWTQGMLQWSIFFGLFALAWSMLLLYHAGRTRNIHEGWNFIATFLWLAANFWWMTGEVRDYQFPKAKPIGEQHAAMSAHILQFAFCWELVYYMIIVPFDLFPLSRESLMEYDDGMLKPTCIFFKNFRQYENLHMLFWIAKDLAWNRQYLLFWYLMLFPALFIATDMIYIAATSEVEDAAIDIVHYVVTFLWVVGNSVWAYGDFFIDDYDKPVHLINASEESLMTARWYSAWILLIDFSLVVMMYILWGLITCIYRLQPASEHAGDNINTITYSSVYDDTNEVKAAIHNSETKSAPFCGCSVKKTSSLDYAADDLELQKITTADDSTPLMYAHEPVSVSAASRCVDDEQMVTISSPAGDDSERVPNEVVDSSVSSDAFDSSFQEAHLMLLPSVNTSNLAISNRSKSVESNLNVDVRQQMLQIEDRVEDFKHTDDSKDKPKGDDYSEFTRLLYS